MNLLKVTFKQTKSTITLKSIIQGLKTNQIDVNAVGKYDFQKVLFPGRIMLVQHNIVQNKREGLISCLTEGDQMSHLFKDVD